MKQELLAYQSVIFCGVNFAQSLVLCVVFCESLFDFLSSNRPEYLHAVNGTTPSQAKATNV